MEKSPLFETNYPCGYLKTNKKKSKKSTHGPFQKA